MALCPAETSQTLDRGLRVLDVLAGVPAGLTVTELAGRLDVNRTVVYRLVSTLEQHALVRRDARGRLHVGLGVLHLASGVQPVLRDLAMPVLRGLAESRRLAPPTSPSPTGRRRWRWPSSSRRGPTSTCPTGSAPRHPLTQGAAGKAILLAGSRTRRAVRRHERRAADRRPRPGRPGAGRRGTEASVGIVTLGGAIDVDVVAPAGASPPPRSPPGSPNGAQVSRAASARAGPPGRAPAWPARSRSTSGRSPGSASTRSMTRWRSVLERATTRAHMSPAPVIV